MDPRLEQILTTALQNQRESSPSLGLSPTTLQSIHNSLQSNIRMCQGPPLCPVVLCAATVRPYFLSVDTYVLPNAVRAVVHGTAARN